MLLSFKLAFPT